MVEEEKIDPRHSRENHLAFLYDLYTQGMPLVPNDIVLLKKHGYIEEKKEETAKGDYARRPTFKDMSTKTDEEEQADSHIDIVEERKENNGTVGTDEEANRQKVIFSGRQEEIKKSEWMPRSTMDHNKDFIEWIDSINFGGNFLNIKYYKPFALYCQQADMWLSRNTSETNFYSDDDKQEYWDKEVEKCNENSLYFLDKYVALKEAELATGSRRYSSKVVHKLIAYLFDCGYSMEIGKPRQIAATSTIGALAVKKLIFSKNYFIKFVTQDKETGEEIFEDKIKYPFGELPDDLKPNVLNDRDNLFKLGYKEVKGTKRGANSKLLVVAPSVSAINGGSPDLVLVDEAGYISIIGRMLKEARPTLFGEDPETGKIRMKRQIIIWGTGGEMDKGGKAYEQEYYSVMKMWKDRNFSSGMVPIFLDWRTRPGMTQEFYDKEKEVYYSVEGPEAQAARIQFHQTYPSSVEDMFLTSLKTLVGIDYITSSLDRIRRYGATQKPQYGFFEPIYDTSKPCPEHSDVPFEVVGANFIPTGGPADERTTTIIFQHPKKWLNRYYQGTDPTASDNGLSKMASAIWDKYYCTLSAVVNYRDPNYKYTFLQCMLLGIYYNVDPEQKGCKEVLEANAGTAYREYKDGKGYWSTMVFNTELPQAFRQQQGTIIGIDNHGIRNKLIIDKMYEVTTGFGDKIFIEEYFIQLKSFTCTITKNGKEVWGPIDKRLYQDDILWAATFSYICSLCYGGREPVELEKVSEEKMEVRFELQYDKDWNLRRMPVRTRVSL